MADTQTALMQLVKPEVGASPDTWGTKWNANADKIEAITVRNTAQWKVTPGDDTPGSGAGPWILSRYDNSAVKIDEPINVNRQTGETVLLKLKALFTTFSNGLFFQYMAAPAIPAAGNAQVFFDVAGNPVIQRPDGTIEYLGVPPGSITFTGASTADPGWALLNGQAISRTGNPRLFARYGILFGAGDTSTTFNLPDARGCTFAHVDGGVNRLTNALRGFGGGGGVSPILGARSGLESNTLDTNALPAHSHVNTLTNNGHTHGYQQASSTRNYVVGAGNAAFDLNIPANTTGENQAPMTINNANAGGGLAHANVQPTLIMNAQVKLG